MTHATLDQERDGHEPRTTRRRTIPSPRDHVRPSRDSRFGRPSGESGAARLQPSEKSLPAPELRVAAPSAAHAIAVLREKQARPTLRAERFLASDLAVLDLVKHRLEPARPLLRLRIRHHFASFAVFFASVFFSALAGGGLPSLLFSGRLFFFSLLRS